MKMHTNLQLVLLVVCMLVSICSTKDLCIPTPCGTNTHCFKGYDRTGAERPVCSCLPGYVGDPLYHCSEDNRETKGSDKEMEDKKELKDQ